MTTVFRFVNVLVLLLITATTIAQDVCSEVSTCVECLESNDCGSWAVGMCMASCNEIADVSCYTTETFPDINVAETCQAVANAQAESALCSSKTNCGDCVSTALLSGESETCQWFPDGEYCGSACGMFGCGVTACGDSSCNGSDFARGGRLIGMGLVTMLTALFVTRTILF